MTVVKTKQLSPQQKIIMQHLVNGMTMKEIQLAMGIKLDTVRTYIRRVRVKVRARSLYQCVAIVVSTGEVIVEDKSLVFEEERQDQ